MPKTFSHITIIYNPNSTGNGKKVADQFAQRLAKVIPARKISVIPTEHAGHAEELAKTLVQRSKRPLIISVSGDGGYHEVINGILTAQQSADSPTAGLLPAGNANDHYRAVHQADTIQRIAQADSRAIDILRLEARSHHQPIIRYAHSYIGVGLTPQIGRELNKTKLNPIKEALIVLRVLFSLKPVRIKIDGEVSSYDSILCSNIGTISKYFLVSNDANVTDGLFEITKYRRRNRLRVLRYVLAASTTGLPNTEQIKTFSFTTVTPTHVQLDGEVITLDARCKVSITIQSARLACII